VVHQYQTCYMLFHFLLLVICFYYYLDHYQFKYGHTLRSQSSVSGADELDGPPLDSPGLSNGSETRATAS